MEKVLADTNILLRGVEPAHPSHFAADNATFTLAQQGNVICVLPQILFEFWNVCTRPIEHNGLGWPAEKTDAELSRIERIFTLLPDSQSIYTEWRRIVLDKAVLGKQVHDARIAAAMKIHQITKLLTFNTKDFKRFSDIKLIDPVTLIVTDMEVDK